MVIRKMSSGGIFTCNIKVISFPTINDLGVYIIVSPAFPTGDIQGSISVVLGRRRRQNNFCQTFRRNHMGFCYLLEKDNKIKYNTNKSQIFCTIIFHVRLLEDSASNLHEKYYAKSIWKQNIVICDISAKFSPQMFIQFHGIYQYTLSVHPLLPLNQH